MRIISGKYKGKKIEGYDIDGTRPTQDRVKESMFAMIQDDITGSTCLDLFAGSGNLGLEAISNGSNKVYFVDCNTECIKTIKNNLINVPLEYYHILKGDYKNALEYYMQKKIKFDIIFLDPPYNLECLDYIINKVIEYNLLNTGGKIVCEYENNKFSDEYLSLQLLKEKKYGYKNIRIYRSEK